MYPTSTDGFTIMFKAMLFINMHQHRKIRQVRHNPGEVQLSRELAAPRHPGLCPVIGGCNESVVAGKTRRRAINRCSLMRLVCTKYY